MTRPFRAARVDMHERGIVGLEMVVVMMVVDDEFTSFDLFGLDVGGFSGADAKGSGGVDAVQGNVANPSVSVFVISFFEKCHRWKKQLGLEERVLGRRKERE